MNHKFFSLLILLLVMTLQVSTQSIEQSLGKASVVFKNDQLTVSTGNVERQWFWTGHGFQTISFKNLHTGKEWCKQPSAFMADWNLPKRINNDSQATQKEVDCIITDDEHFTDKHLLVTANIRYDIGMDLKFLVRVYPEAQGIWTALEVKADEGFSAEGIPEETGIEKYWGSNQPVKVSRADYIPVSFSEKNNRRYWGFYHDPGNRVNTRDMVKEKTIDGFPLFQEEQITWASGLSIQKEGEGLILLKESNKTVNSSGHQTGAFYCTQAGVEITGWGLKPSEISNEYKRTWPTWSILYEGGEADMQLALKQFDRRRFPINFDTDLHILVDTWGSDWRGPEYDDKLYGRENSRFEIVEKEIKSAADLGIDIVRIDDGWQDGKTKCNDCWYPDPDVGYEPGWKNLKEVSESHHVNIGLWAAINDISKEELFKNQQQLNVATWKFDFDEIKGHDDFTNRLAQVRDLIKFSDYSTQAAFCLEYEDPRYGWYSAVRECGPMYFQNIQNNMPFHLIYVPYITLRHHWMMSRFYNMTDLKTNWQNPSRTNPKYSDAKKHSQSYCALSGFVGSPVAFFLTQYLKPDERDELRKLIAIYQDHKNEIFERFEFPIGSEPNNASWTGFQFYHPDKTTGYLMIFRELNNENSRHQMELRFLNNMRLNITDLETGKSRTAKVVNNKISFSISKPAGYKFLKYEVLN